MSRPSVSDTLIGDRELSEVVTDHVRLHFHETEVLTVVNTQLARDHLWDHDRISEMGLDWSRLLSWGAVGLLWSA